eukprot:TRINITY_DN17091_c0_g1_i1.p1 TRINITY_DN17091_c0_g1~~TRINITY_DN17091_c0_g1_i1.p1  ORF type:complete len:221 (-),score=25.20 TRINITY_DN17091_c0_g1_i1:578-1240(-)
MFPSVYPVSRLRRLPTVFDWKRTCVIQGDFIKLHTIQILEGVKSQDWETVLSALKIYSGRPDAYPSFARPLRIVFHSCKFFLRARELDSFYELLRVAAQGRWNLTPTLNSHLWNFIKHSNGIEAAVHFFHSNLKEFRGQFLLGTYTNMLGHYYLENNYLKAKQIFDMALNTTPSSPTIVSALYFLKSFMMYFLYICNANISTTSFSITFDTRPIAAHQFI